MDPTIAYNPAPPVNPLEQTGRVLQLKNLLGQGQLQQQQLQAGQLDNQQRQMQLDQSRALLDTAKNIDWTQPDAYDKFLSNAQASGKVNPQTLSSMALQRANYQEQLAKTSTAVLGATKEANNQFLGHIDAVKGIADPGQRQQAAQSQASQILSSPELVKYVAPQVQQQLQAMKQGQYVPTDDDLSKLEIGSTDHNTQIDQRLTNAKADNEAAQAGLNQIKLNLSKNSKPGDFDQLIDQAAPQNGANAALNSRTKQLVNFALQRGDYEGAQKAVQQMSDQLGSIEKETNPAVQASKLHLATAEKAAEQAIADGDPRAAAQLLISGTVAPSQLVSSRKPAFAQQAFSAAAQMQPGWSATKADADYKVASSPQNVAFFGSAKSLTDKGGTLDQLADAAKDIPDGKIPVFNSIGDAWKAATGSGPIAKYAAIYLGVADDYSKVMGGGQGSDTSRGQALKLLPANASPEARAAAIEGIRGAVNSQTNSRIGNNAVLRKMYGSDSATRTYQGHTYTQQSDGSWRLQQ